MRLGKTSNDCSKAWLGHCMHKWGRWVVHVFDRGFAGGAVARRVYAVQDPIWVVVKKGMR